jgi:hypothetical protein
MTVALLRSLVADRNGEGRVGMEGAKEFYNRGREGRMDGSTNNSLLCFFGFEAANHVIRQRILDRGRQCGCKEDLL